MDELISRRVALDALCESCDFFCNDEECFYKRLNSCYERNAIMSVPSVQPEIIRCKDCKNQEKFFQKDGRRKDGGYYIYGCSLAEGYSHVCLDDDYCSRAERRTDE